MSFENGEESLSGLEEGRAWKKVLDLEDPAWPRYPEQICPCVMSLHAHLPKILLVAPKQLSVQGLAQFDSQ